MRKGFTLFESMIIVFIIGITMMFSLPKWTTNNEYFILNRETALLHLFLRTMQSRSENSSEIWLMRINQGIDKKQWCISIQPKSEEACDCLNPINCGKESYSHFYYPYFKQQTTIESSKYYPTKLTSFNGIRHTNESGCFTLVLNSQRMPFSFTNTGDIKLGRGTSACK